MNSWTPTTLAHELGHLLGMVGGVEHTHDYDVQLEGFDLSNVMASYLDDQGSAERSHLSLGQAFRMNWDANSFLVQRVLGIEGLSCGDDPYGIAGNAQPDLNFRANRSERPVGSELLHEFVGDDLSVVSAALEPETTAENDFWGHVYGHSTSPSDPSSAGVANGKQQRATRPRSLKKLRPRAGIRRDLASMRP